MCWQKKEIFFKRKYTSETTQSLETCLCCTVRYCLVFSLSSFLKVETCCFFSLLYIVVNSLFLGFGRLVAKEKIFEDVIIGSQNWWVEMFTIVWHFVCSLHEVLLWCVESNNQTQYEGRGDRQIFFQMLLNKFFIRRDGKGKEWPQWYLTIYWTL